MALVYLNGTLVPEEAATVSVFDHGLVVGDGVFETILVIDGRPVALGRHLERLGASAAGLGIAAPERAELEEAVSRVLAGAVLARGRLRITVTSGNGPLGSARAGVAPTVVVAAAPDGMAEPAVSVVVAPWPRNERGALAGLKTTSYAENARALDDARRKGASEAIFANTAGMLCEGTGSNVFLVVDGRLVTPTLASGCLAGVTRALVLDHWGGEEADVPVDALRPGAASEAFLTSTLRGVQSIAAVDGTPFGGIGPVTAAAAARYDELVESGAI